MKAAFDIKALKSGGLFPILAALAVLVALWFAWGGWQVYSANRVQRAAEEGTKQVAAEVQKQVASLLSRASALTGRSDLATALRAGNGDAARAIVMQAMPGAEAAETYAPGFASAYADLAKFGYGKLGLLERASADGKAVLAVVKDAGGPRLAVAVPVVEGAQVLGVAYVREPIAAALKAAEGGAPPGAYLAVRQNSYNVVESGDQELRTRPEKASQAIPGTNLRLVAMAPEAEAGLFGAKGMGEFGLALFLLALAPALIWWSRRTPRAVAVVVA